MSGTVAVEAIEALRSRQSQLSHALTQLLQTVYAIRGGTALAPAVWDDLYSHFRILLSHLHSLSLMIQQHADQLAKTSVFPLPLFPVRENEELLTTLMRRRVPPDVTERENTAVREEEKEVAGGSASGVEEQDAIKANVVQSALEDLESRDWEELIMAGTRASDGNDEGSRKAMPVEDVLRYMYYGKK